MSELDPAQRRLAQAYGVATDYYDWQGHQTVIGADTITGVLAALGVEASTTAAAVQALAEHELAPWRRPLPPCLVAQQGSRLAATVHAPPGAGLGAELILEGGTRQPLVLPEPSEQREIDGARIERSWIELPVDLPLGYHRLQLVVADPSSADTADTDTTKTATHETTVIITPPWLGMPAAAGDRRLWGLAAQLYSVRSRQSWGVGDLGDLATLCRWSGGEHQAGYILINPLHAAEPVPPMEPSPYLPTTRRFVNPLYIRVEDVAECAGLEPQARARVEELRGRVQQSSESWERIDRDAAWAAKREALLLIFAVPHSSARGEAFAAYQAREGTGLTDFATWNALAQVYGADWSSWPQSLQHPSASAVVEFRADHLDEISFECWLQWVIDEQLGAAQQEALDAGMALGVMKDLAVGVHPRGAETWALRDVYAEGVGVGAPPDAYNQNGQNWSQPPWRPDKLAEAGYAPFRELVATMLRNAGGVRVDHVVGLFRLWWIPSGLAPTAGTYVRYDHEAMVGILALEAHRAGAVVVGEDLGTVEPSAREYLKSRGILGTSILWFEGDWEGDGSPLAASRWREYCLASVNTHDLPPTAAYLTGDHVRLRDRLGLLTRPVEEELQVAEDERTAWLDRLRADGLLSVEPNADPDVEQHNELLALHRFLTRTPARLLNLALVDAIGDRRTQNQPGTTDEYPNWRVPLSAPDGTPVALEDVMADPLAAALMAALGSD